MKQSINFSQFYDAFQSIRPDDFTYDGLKALYDWIEEMDDSCGTETELDVIALGCEFTEYDSADMAACEYFTFEGMSYDEEGNELDSADEVEEKALEYLHDHTTVITFDSGIIIQAF